MSSESSTPIIYRLDPDALPLMLERHLVRGTAIAVFWCYVAAFVSLLVTAGGQALDSAIAVLVCTAVVALIQARRIRQRLKVERLRWGSYQLTLGNDSIRFQDESARPIEIHRPEVTRVVDTPGQGLTVMSVDGPRVIVIPEQLQGFATVKKALSRWKEPEWPRELRSWGRVVGWTLFSALLCFGPWILPFPIPALLVLGVGPKAIQVVRQSRVMSSRAKLIIVLTLAAMFCLLAGRLFLAWFKLGA